MAFTRRQFLAAGVAAPFVMAANPHRKFRTALIGSGWWGKNILKEAMESGKCKIVALGDVDASTLEAAADQVKDLSGDAPKTYGDFRELLEKEKPEIVIVATPDHWHALITIAALKSGAHVFVEKPTATRCMRAARC
jgi:predicted dehydrogenase